MATRTEDLTVVQGTDALFKINIKDSAGNAFDITDKSFSASMKKSFSAADNTKIDFTTNIVNAQSGIVSISLDNTDTANLDTATRYVYDLLMYNTSGNTDITSILSGKVFITPSVTRVS